MANPAKACRKWRCRNKGRNCTTSPPAYMSAKTVNDPTTTQAVWTAPITLPKRNRLTEQVWDNSKIDEPFMLINGEFLHDRRSNRLAAIAALTWFRAFARSVLQPVRAAWGLENEKLPFNNINSYPQGSVLNICVK